MSDRTARTSRFAPIAAIFLLTATRASAQRPTFEIGANVGYTLSDGVETSADYLGAKFSYIEPVDAVAWGFTAGAILQGGWEIDFLWSRQESELQLSGLGPEQTLSALNVDNYHGLIVYNFPSYRVATSFLFGGLGATSYGGIEVGGEQASGETKFSTTWGGGLKFLPEGRAVGGRLMIRWTPTYVKTDPGSVWCDPYWGCYSVGNAQYSHQVEFSAGVILRLPMR